MYKLAVFSMLVFAAAAFAQQAPLHPGQPSEEYLRDWLVLGPIPASAPLSAPATSPDAPAHFNTDFLEPMGGEEQAAPEPGDTVAIGGKAFTWTRYESPDDAVNLDEAISKENEVCGYAYTELEAPEETVALCALGTNDGCRVWLNGDLVHEYPEERGLTPDDDIFPVLLNQGTNRLLLKVDERGNWWRLSVRFRPFTVTELRDKLDLFNVRLKEDGAPQLRFRHGEGVQKKLIASATFTITEADAPERMVWQGAWNGRYRMDLPVDTAEYGEYALEGRLVFAGGGTHTQTVYFSAGTPVDYTLFADGASGYAIVRPDDAPGGVQWVANELRHWLMEAGAPELPVTADAGDAPALRLVQTGADPADESFVYHNDGADIVFEGASERAVMYAALTFLERELGVRWYTPSVTVAPKRDAFTFRRLHHAGAPGIRVRNDFYKEAFDPTWAARNKINGAMNYREQPGGVEAYWAVHTFFPLMPPDEFFEDHPEYYSLIDGKRTAGRTQLCLTNPDVLDIITDRIKKRMRENPDYLIYSVSQNDWRNPCQCANCQAIVEREGSEAGPLIWFVNQVAERVEQEFPGKFIGTLAYQYTRKPPKHIKPRENVVVRFCSIECCFAHPFTECPQNAQFLEDLRGWAAIAPHLYIWDYVVNFSHYIMPYPNFPVLKPNIQTFRDNKAIGIMEQAAYQSRGGEFAELRAYVIAKLLWNPEAEVQPIIDDFMYGYYGRAGQYVRAYFDLLHAQVTPDTHFGLGMQPDDAVYSDTFVCKAEELFDKAETVAETVAVRHRVQMARLPVLYLKCLRNPAQAVRDGSYARFTDIAEREGITHYAERGASHREAFHTRMRQYVEKQ